jgi:hypothetical protein
LLQPFPEPVRSAGVGVGAGYRDPAAATVSRELEALE